MTSFAPHNLLPIPPATLVRLSALRSTRGATLNGRLAVAVGPTEKSAQSRVAVLLLPPFTAHTKAEEGTEKNEEDPLSLPTQNLKQITQPPDAHIADAYVGIALAAARRAALRGEHALARDVAKGASETVMEWGSSVFETDEDGNRADCGGDGKEELKVSDAAGRQNQGERAGRAAAQLAGLRLARASAHRALGETCEEVDALRAYFAEDGGFRRLADVDGVMVIRRALVQALVNCGDIVDAVQEAEKMVTYAMSTGRGADEPEERERKRQRDMRGLMREATELALSEAKGRSDSALVRRACEAVVRVWPRHAAALWWLGEMVESEGDEDGAQRFYERAIRGGEGELIRIKLNG